VYDGSAAHKVEANRGVRLLPQPLQGALALCYRLNTQTQHSTLNTHAHYSQCSNYAEVEAASDARYIHDALRKILQAPVFLDSSSLKDLRSLIGDGLYRSDVLLLLLSRAVLTRPWCLLEVFFARTHSIPICPVALIAPNSDFSWDDMIEYVTHLPERMGRENPAGLLILETELGSTPVRELQDGVLSVLKDCSQKVTLQWNPSVGDQAMLASLKDIVESMATMTGRTLEWTAAAKNGEGQAKPKSRTLRKLARGATGISIEQLRKKAKGKAAVSKSRRPSAKRVFDDAAVSAAFISFAPEHLSSARVLKAELSRKLNCFVGLGNDADTPLLVPHTLAHVVMLTEHVLTTPSCILEIFSAIKAGLPVITILVDQGGYNFQESSQRLSSASEWARGLSEADVSAQLSMLVAALRLPGSLSAGFTREDVRLSLFEAITSIIAIPWQPQGGVNHFVAVMADVASRIPPLPGTGMGGRGLSMRTAGRSEEPREVIRRSKGSRDSANDRANRPSVDSV